MTARVLETRQHDPTETAVDLSVPDLDFGGIMPDVDNWQPVTTPGPAQPAVNVGGIPSELKALCQWVVWKNGIRNGKKTKIPFQVNGLYAKSNDPSTWATFGAVLAAYQRGGFDGIGLCFGGELVGIDLDLCFDDAGNLTPWAADILDLCPLTYIEVSPSGKGLHLLCIGALPEVYNERRQWKIGDHCGVEVYAYPSHKYFTVTGRIYGESHALCHVEPIDFQPLAYYLNETIAKKPERRETTPAQLSPQVESLRSDDDVIRIAGRAKNADKMIALLQGDITGYPSQSEADAALCAALAFYTKDAGQIDRIFRRSGLYRPKWDQRHHSNGATYGQATIDRALALNGGAA
jgi:putative DNA primase/helicase